MNVIIKSFVDTLHSEEENIKNNAITMVDSLDKEMEDVKGEDVITKLYYIAPLVGKIFVVVSKEDAKTLNIDSQILADRDIKDYPLERMPAKIIEYKELNIKKGNDIKLEDVVNVAQTIADETFEKVAPNKIPVVKILNYNGQAVKSLAMPSIFKDNVFYSLSGVVANGDAKAGKETMEKISKQIVIKTIGDEKYIASQLIEFNEENKDIIKLLRGNGASKIKVGKDRISVSGYSGGDQKEKSPNEIQIPLTGLEQNQFVRFLMRIRSYDNFYKYEFKILDKDNKKIFLKYSEGSGASNGVPTPREEWFYAYMPVIETTAKYCIGESWARDFDIKEVAIVNKIPQEDKTNNIKNVNFS